MRQLILRRAPFAAAVLLCGALLGDAAALAQEAPAQFLIERIVIEGLQRETARQIVLAESLLESGRSYSEADLRAAVHRVNRLPFVVDADMALRRGSERGSYELVITVEGARPLFYGVELLSGYAGNRTNFRLALDTGTLLTAGARRFVGSRGLLFGSVQAPGYSELDPVVVTQAGYTRYGLFAGEGYGTVAVAASLGGGRDEERQASVQLGVPLSGDHALRGGLAFTRIDRDLRFFGVEPRDARQDAWTAELAWLYDSTDDPIAPWEGSRITVAGEYSDRQEEVFVARDVAPPHDPLDFEELDAQQWLLRLEGRRYHALTPRQSVGLGGYAWYTSETVRHLSSDSIEDLLGVEALHALSLRRVPGAKEDLRLESAFGVQRLRDDDTFFLEDGENLNALARVSLLFRNAWGLARISFIYVERIGGGP